MAKTTWMAAMAVCCALGARADEAPVLAGKVAEALDGGRYSYLEVDTGTGRVWVACYQVAAAVGDPVAVSEGRVMENFTSPTLKRTFDRIVFASALRVGTNMPGARALPPGHPPMDGSPHSGGSPHAGMMHGGLSGTPPTHGDLVRGEVIETMEGGGYTYVQVKTDKETIWAATDHFDVKTGDRVAFAPGLSMSNFESPTLKRKFETIQFVDAIRRDDGKPGAAGLPPGHP